MNVLDNGLLKCSICDASNYKTLVKHIRCYHKITIPEYLEEYPDDLIYTKEMQENFSKGGYNANKAMRDTGFDFSERSRKARETELKNDPDAYYKRNQRLMQDPEFRERATQRILSVSPSYYKYPHEYNGVTIYFKSSWELIFAEFLESINIDYEYEKVSIPYYCSTEQRNRLYFPDFYIYDKNLMIEIKPKCDLNDQTVQEKAKACIDKGYKFKFITQDELFNNNLNEDLLNE